MGDIDGCCKGGGRYYTRLGSERIYVSRQMAVQKKAGEMVQLTLRRTPSGMEIVELK